MKKKDVFIALGVYSGPDAYEMFVLYTANDFTSYHRIEQWKFQSSFMTGTTFKKVLI